MSDARPTPAVSTRRAFLRSTSAAAIGAVAYSAPAVAAKPEYPPVRQITRGPKHHWFGYYDKLEFDPTNRYVLSNEVAFEHRSPQADDVIGVGMVDSKDNDKWVPIGQTRAWGWQQGCMLQWRPGSKSQVVWNDRAGDTQVCHIHDVKTGERRTLPRPIYALSPDGRYAITADFRRIQNMRPGYGYVGLQDPFADINAPKDSGVWRMDLDSGKAELILSLADVAKIAHNGQDVRKFWHYFNHLLVSPDGSRFIVLHRWRKDMKDPPARRAVTGFTTRMLTANMDGSGLYILDPSGYTSHFIWRDPQHVCAWTRPRGKPAAFYLFKDKTDQVEVVGKGVMTRNGHNTYLPKPHDDWILNDTYPDGKRMQRPYLFHVPTERRVELGAFHLPPKYRGEWRCDTHPRASSDGLTVAIDSPHTGQGRQVHLIDVSGIVRG